MSEAEAPPSDRRRINSLEELVPLVELADIVTLRLSGEREEGQAEAVAGDRSGDDGQPIAVYQRSDDTEIEVRCVLALSTGEARVLSDIAAIYTLAEPLEIPSEVLSEFTQMVGMMAVYPYLRESIQTTASRMRVPVPVLRLLRQGEFELTSQPVGGHPLDTPTSTTDS